MLAHSIERKELPPLRVIRETLQSGVTGEEMPKVLIVDDDPNTVEMLAKALTLFGHQAERAFSGEEALEQGNAQPPALIRTSSNESPPPAQRDACANRFNSQCWQI